MTIQNNNKSGYKLYLDDIRNPKTNGWVIARCYEDFVSIIEKGGVPDEISFDHDLGWDEENNCERKSGYDCAKWLVCKNIVLENFNVHSANPVGAEQIKSLLTTYKKFIESKKKGEYNLTFQENSMLGMVILSMQPPVTIEKMRKQANRHKKQGEKRFAKEAPEMQRQLKLIQTPLSFSDTRQIYRWLCRKQITIDMISKEVLKEFEDTELYEKFVKRQKGN